MGLTQVRKPIEIIWAITVQRPLKQQIPINNNHLEQSNIRERKRGGCRSLVAEHWQLKPEALGLIPGGTTFLSFPLLFQRSLDSYGPDNLYRSSDLRR